MTKSKKHIYLLCLQNVPYIGDTVVSKKSPAKVRTSQRAKFLVLAVPLFIILAILTGNYTKSVSAEKKEKAAEDEKIATAAKLLKQTDMSEEKMRA